jgi:hypothetical protein
MQISSNIGFKIRIKTLATIIDNLFTSTHGFFFSAGISDISPVISVPTGIRKYRPYRYIFFIFSNLNNLVDEFLNSFEQSRLVFWPVIPVLTGTF